MLSGVSRGGSLTKPPKYALYYSLKEWKHSFCVHGLKSVHIRPSYKISCAGTQNNRLNAMTVSRTAIWLCCLCIVCRPAPGSHSEDITLKSCHSLVRERREKETRSDKQHRAGSIWSQQRQQTGEQQAAKEPTATQRCGTDGGGLRHRKNEDASSQRTPLHPLH